MSSDALEVDRGTAPCGTSSSSTASAPRSARPATRACTPRPAPTTWSSRCIRELLRRHPELPPERIDEVAIAATTQTGDQGLTIGRTAALLAGLPRSVPGFAIDRMCAGAMTAVTTVASRHRVRRLRRGDRRRRRAHGPPPDGRGRRPQPAVRRREAGRPVRAGRWARPRRTCTTASRRSPSERADAFAVRQPGQARQGLRGRQDRSPTWCRSRPRSAELGWGLATADEPPRPGHHGGGAGRR